MENDDAYYGVLSSFFFGTIRDPPPPVKADPLHEQKRHSTAATDSLFLGMGVGDFDDGVQDRFTVRAGPPMSGGRMAPPNAPPPNFAGAGGGGNMSTGGAFSSAATGGVGPYDGVPGHRQHSPSPAAMMQQQGGLHSSQQAGGGGDGHPEMVGYDGKDTDWSVFSASSAAVFNIGSEAAAASAQAHLLQQHHQQQQHQQQQQPHQQQVQQQQQQQVQQQDQSLSPPSDRPSMAHAEGGHSQHQSHLSGLPPISRGADSNPTTGVSVDIAASRSSSAGILGAASGSASRAGSVSSGGTPPQVGRPVPVWNSMSASAPLRGSDGGGGVARGGAGSPPGGVGGVIANAMLHMKRLSITSDDSGGAVSFAGCL